MNGYLGTGTYFAPSHRNGTAARPIDAPDRGARRLLTRESDQQRARGAGPGPRPTRPLIPSRWPR